MLRSRTAGPVVVRVGCAGFAVMNLWWGLWATLWPAHFFATFPGFGHRWTAAYPPYNEHLVSDLGATFVTLAFLLAAGAIASDRRVRMVVLAGTLIFNALHLWFHAMTAGTMGSADYRLSLASLAFGVLAPVALLLVDLLASR